MNYCLHDNIFVPKTSRWCNNIAAIVCSRRVRKISRSLRESFFFAALPPLPRVRVYDFFFSTIFYMNNNGKLYRCIYITITGRFDSMPAAFFSNRNRSIILCRSYRPGNTPENALPEFIPESTRKRHRRLAETELFGV